MKILLNPRSAEAYGQDLLANALSKTCGLATLTAADGSYTSAHSELALVVSMNLDEKADSEFVCSLPRHVATVAHVHCRYHYYSDRQKKYLASALSRVSTGIVPAEFHKYEMAKVFPNVDWRVVHNGVDTTRFAVATDEERCQFRQKLGLAEGTKIVLFTGRLEDAKGLQILRQFATRISKTKMVLLVQFPTNSLRAEDTNAAVARTLQEICPERVKLHADKDFRTERPVRFADILITPSLSEVAPLVVLEAFNAGVVVIGTAATPFYDELCSTGIPDTAFTFLPVPTSEQLGVERKLLGVSDSAASQLAKKLSQLAESLPNNTYTERQLLSRAAYNAGFNQDLMLSGFQAVYDDVLSSTGPNLNVMR